VVFLVRILHLGLLLHRGSGLPGPDEGSWRVLVDRLVASFGHNPSETPRDTPSDTPSDSDREDSTP
jgi:hypothetical protein